MFLLSHLIHAPDLNAAKAKRENIFGLGLMKHGISVSFATSTSLCLHKTLNLDDDRALIHKQRHRTILHQTLVYFCSSERKKKPELIFVDIAL